MKVRTMKKRAYRLVQRSAVLQGITSDQEAAVLVFLNARRADGSVWGTLPDLALARMQGLFTHYWGSGNRLIYANVLRCMTAGDALGATRGLLGLALTHVALPKRERRIVVSLLARQNKYALHVHGSILSEVLMGFFPLQRSMP
jgi:hypothetical protein